MSQVQSIRYRERNKHLSFEERRTLENSRLKRGEVEQVDSIFKTYMIYSSDLAQDDYEQKATSKGKDLKIGKDHKLASHIDKRILKDKYSPDAIVMELEKTSHDFTVTLSTWTIYNYIEKDVFLQVTNKDLLRQGRHRKRTYQRVRKRGLDPGA